MVIQDPREKLRRTSATRPALKLKSRAATSVQRTRMPLRLYCTLLSGGAALCAGAKLRSCAPLAPAGSAAAARLLSLRGGGASKRIEACLFDFDGTLAQSEDTHRRTFSEILGFELTEDYWNAHCVGNSPRKLLETNMPEGRLEELGETIDRLLVKRSELFEQHIERGLLEATGGAQVTQGLQRVRFCTNCASSHMRLRHPNSACANGHGAVCTALCSLNSAFGCSFPTKYARLLSMAGCEPGAALWCCRNCSKS